MNKQFFLFILLFAKGASLLQAQIPVSAGDTLPGFYARNAGGNRVIIGWTNNYPDVKQISIQRSFDSLTRYMTISTVPDPSAIQNGFVDMKAPNDHMFYRLFILRENGRFEFATARRPVVDTARRLAVVDPDKKLPLIKIPSKAQLGKDSFIVDNKLVLMKTDTVMTNGKPVVLRAQPVVIGLVLRSDSVATPNPIYNTQKVEAFTPSLHVFTNRDGYVRIKLPDDEKTKKISIRFYEDTGSFLFELKELKEYDFKLDKTNFYHAGWFRFEIFENGKLIERHKFYIEKDF